VRRLFNALTIPCTGNSDLIQVWRNDLGEVTYSVNAGQSVATPNVTLVQIFAGGGNDTIAFHGGIVVNTDIDGGNGNDEIAGGEGNDEITGGSGLDGIDGHGGHDVISGGDENDVLYGGEGNDVLDGDAGNDYLYGNQDSDYLNGGSGTDWMYGGSGDDFFFGLMDDEADLADGGADTDEVGGFDYIDTITEIENTD
jgi:Ca2+-binding RTX toxin-like protein